MQAGPRKKISPNREKRLCALALLCALCLALTGCGRIMDKAEELCLLWLMARGDQHTACSEIEQVILQNRDALENDILAGRAERWEDRSGIRSVSADDDRFVNFSFGAWGIVPEGGYSGFNYSPDDQPYDIQHFTYGPLTPLDGGWIWLADDGSDNTFHTRRVTERFFWYEYHF